ncbi:MAG: aminobenzoyl-glutamate transporter [Proteobacteria bacterium]|nr:MAG: aminobenzoyl-glutamate transporter [Pseudomonadota bacterium]
MTEDSTAAEQPPKGEGRLLRMLDWVERTGNKLPDPAILFLVFLIAVWVLSALLAPVEWSAIDPRTGDPLRVRNMLSGEALTGFMAQMVSTFVNFPPLGVVLVAMLGIGVAEHTGMINASLRGLLAVTSKRLLTPMLIAVGILSHTAVDAGYVLVIPLGAVIYHVAGRHPLAGVAAAFAGVSGGFSATFIPSSLDPLLQGLSQAGAQILDPDIVLNPLNNYFFTTASSLLIVGLGWFLTDRVVEPRLKGTAVDGDTSDAPQMEPLTPEERRALRWSLIAMLAGLVLLFVSAWPVSSPWRSPDGVLAAADAPLMQSIVPLIFVLFIIPGIVYGYVSGTVRTHRDVIAGMTHSMSGMAYYIVMAFFAAQFIAVFGQSNLGALLAVEGATWLQESRMPVQITLIGIVLITAFVNLLVGSASAKWALLAPILVPMLMVLGISPDLTQAAYRVGDSSTNIITPLMPYFPLVVVFCRRYVRSSGIGTVVAMMLPYSLTFLVVWTAFLLLYWALGIPLGLQASYVYPAP